ncbi:hypothetical protein Daura_39810 [Dactylosporangium aurantiacum]|uniref:Uncharacterized protein n=1 Tax=Dactylosporangium aurantiacum TaxID=35754 RepID=A0A9Q9MBA6_9ACTN|nr:radical SAM-modified peptide, FtsH ternary system-associated [Dactylosporangium aurantiacum]MDG6101428.1 hypothetical protein [Dactylosporangium aurantiacum]UWZ52718.1 hypothetical protein Daura_39810 [Dactylosporangium aurantiacum]
MSEFKFVENLPDLIQPEEYAEHPQGRLVRFQVSVTEEGVEVLGDAFRPEVIEAILRGFDPPEIEQMLCG